MLGLTAAAIELQAAMKSNFGTERWGSSKEGEQEKERQGEDGEELQTEKARMSMRHPLQEHSPESEPERSVTQSMRQRQRIL